MKNRVAFIDMLKVIAILGVITIHVSSGALYLFDIRSFNWYTSVFWACVVRWSVPVFFMCSGAIFLNSDKQVTIKQIFTKYLLRIVVALVFWAAMYELFDVYRIYNATGIVDATAIRNGIKNLVTLNTHFHLYYLYIIILIYALLPIIKIFTNNAGKQQMEYALVLWVFLGIVFPFALKFYPFNMIQGIAIQYGLKMAYSSIGYFVLGHYFYKYTLSKPVTHIIYVVGIIGVISTLYGTIKFSVSSQSVNAIFLEGMTPNVAAMAAALFLSVKNLYISVGKKHKVDFKLISYISKASFCIYLVHDFFNMAYKMLNIDTAIFRPLFSIPYLVLVNFCLSLAVYFVLSKIPVVKKYLI